VPELHPVRGHPDPGADRNPEGDPEQQDHADRDPDADSHARADGGGLPDSVQPRARELPDPAAAADRSADPHALAHSVGEPHANRGSHTNPDPDATAELDAAADSDADPNQLDLVRLRDAGSRSSLRARTAAGCRSPA